MGSALSSLIREMKGPAIPRNLQVFFSLLFCLGPGLFRLLCFCIFPWPWSCSFLPKWCVGPSSSCFCHSPRMENMDGDRKLLIIEDRSGCTCWDQITKVTHLSFSHTFSPQSILWLYYCMFNSCLYFWIHHFSLAQGFMQGFLLQSEKRVCLFSHSPKIMGPPSC